MYEPYMQKLRDRKVSFSKATFPSETAMKGWEYALSVELMSSEESDYDDGKEIPIIHQILWL